MKFFSLLRKKSEIDVLKDRINELEQSRAWKLYKYVDVTSSTTEDLSGINFKELYIFVGKKNSNQCFGGWGVIIPYSSDSGNNIACNPVYSGANGSKIADNVYVYLRGTDKLLTLRTLGTVNEAVLARIYYR